MDSLIAFLSGDTPEALRAKAKKLRLQATAARRDRDFADEARLEQQALALLKRARELEFAA